MNRVFSSPFRRLILLLALGLPMLARGEKVEFQDCYARWENGRLTVGNTHFERAWVTGDAGLMPVSFVLKNPDTEWLADSARKVKVSGKLEVAAGKARRSVVGSEGIRIEVTAKGKTTERQLIWVFPEMAGVIAERLDGSTAVTVVDQRQASGIEVEPAQAERAAAVAGGETLPFAPQHLRVTEVGLLDRTDKHNELVHEREWLLWVNEDPLDLQGCVLTAENVLDGSGIAFLKLAPLPHARPDTQAADFRVRPGARAVTTFFNGYPVAAVGYRGGKMGRTRALHTIQRSLRNYVAGRDGQFLSNTWGDRSRDARINEEFLLQEVAAGAALGVDVMQIDDGWQKGRSANSADARGKGVWNGYWAADPNFWDPDPVRFPNGLETVVKAAQEKGLKFGLWFGPDSSNDAANWQKDADHLLAYHRKLGIDYYKIDSMKTHNAESLKRQRAMFDRMLEGSNGAITFDLDVTAEIRPGYFGLADIGPIFLQNRYTDWRSYWPHLTLRNLWMLTQTVDPLRLRIEVLNSARNAEQYGGDPLAPARYRADTLFAMAMMSNPLGWFEASNLPEEYVAQMKPLVDTWKVERARMHGGFTTPVGEAPDGVSWAGFVSSAGEGAESFVLLFRELNEKDQYQLDISWLKNATRAKVIGGRGTAAVGDGSLTVRVPEKLDFIWVKLE